MSLLDEIKHPFRYGNVVTQIVVINVICFLLIALFHISIILAGYQRGEIEIIFGNVTSYLFLPVDPWMLLMRPWTIITHIFMHAGIGHLFWNMLVFYFFGRIFQEFTGNKRILAIFIMGAWAGALLALLGLNLIPAFSESAHGSYMLGASAGVNAIVLATATLMPDYTVMLLLLGPVRIKYIALFYLIIDLTGIATFVNAGGHIAHIGGALFGFLFVVLLRNGTDLSRGFNKAFAFIKKPFGVKVKKRMSVISGSGRSDVRGISDADYNYSKAERQKRIDAILDKINRSGYESLTKEEKQFLYNNSRDV